MAALGDILYRGASVWKRLVGNTTTTRKFLRQVGDGVDSAAPAWDQVTDADLSLSDVTTNNVTTSAHGFVPKAPNDTTKFLRGDATWAVPSGGGASALDDLTDVTISSPSTGQVLKYSGSAWVNDTDATGSGGAPTDASYVTLGTNGTLSDERVLTAGAGISITDGGAGSTVTIAATGGSSTRSVGITIDGAGSVITTGIKGFVYVPFACTITAATLLSTDASVTSGSIVVDVWNDALANYPPTVADTITASAKPTISSATYSTDSTLTGWSTSISAGDVLGFTVDSVTSLKRVTVVLTVTT